MKYTLMHKEQPVLEMELSDRSGRISDIVEVYSTPHVPLGIMEDGKLYLDDLDAWWTGRSIPASRSGIKQALDVLGFDTPHMLLDKSFGLSLSDQYWVRPSGQTLRWSDINFFYNAFSEDVGNILFGQTALGESLNLVSPDNTSDGLLKKRWKIIDGTRCMIKGGARPFFQEPFNEVFATRLMERLGVAHVPYHLIWIEQMPYSVCPDFVTADTELVSAHYINMTLPKQPDTTRLEHYLQCCDTLGIPNVRPHLDKMLTVDFLLANEDRHWGNFGALRDANTLKWIGPAPIYDCGTSMWYDNIFRYAGPEEDCPSKPFAESHAKQIKLVESFDWLNLGALDGAEQELEGILADAVRFMDEDRMTTLTEAFRGRIQQLTALVQELRQEQGCGRSPDMTM